LLLFEFQVGFADAAAQDKSRKQQSRARQQTV
jgi:hypothetical protein